MTETPWPVGAKPTPGQALDWLRVCTEDEGRAALARLMDTADRASRCFIEDHEGRLARESTPWSRTLAELLRLALRQNVGLRNDLNDLVTLLRKQEGCCCVDTAQLLLSTLERHR